MVIRPQHFAGHDLLEEGRAHGDHAIEHSHADIGDDPLAQPGDQIVSQSGTKRQKRGNAQGCEEILVQKLGCPGLKPVDHTAHSHRQGQRYTRRQDERRKGPQEHAGIGPQKRHQRPK